MIFLDDCKREGADPCRECGRGLSHDGACPVFALLYPKTAEHFARLGRRLDPEEALAHQEICADQEAQQEPSMESADDWDLICQDALNQHLEEEDPDDDAEHFRGSEHEEHFADLPERDGP